MQRLRTDWSAALQAAEAFVKDRPAAEAGCLYLSPAAGGFIAPAAGGSADAVPHFGRPGGVLPRLLHTDRFDF